MKLQDAIDIFCLKGKCHYNDNSSCVDLEEDVSTLLELLKTLHHQTKIKSHFPCVVKLVNKCLINICGILKSDVDSESLKKEEFDKIIELLTITCVLPDVCFPLKLKHDSDNDSEYELNHRLNPILSYECLDCYNQLLLIGTEKNKSIVAYQRNIVKKTASQLMIFICGRLGAFSWTDRKIKDKCGSLLKFICKAFIFRVMILVIEFNFVA